MGARRAGVFERTEYVNVAVEYANGEIEENNRVPFGRFIGLSLLDKFNWYGRGRMVKVVYFGRRPDGTYYLKELKEKPIPSIDSWREVMQ